MVLRTDAVESKFGRTSGDTAKNDLITSQSYCRVARLQFFFVF